MTRATPTSGASDLMTRVVLVTGKGGVGKTTVAAATAVRAAGRGRRVLVTSTDPAHSLADAYDVALGDEPTPVADGLEAQQIDAQSRLERHWHDVRSYLVELLAWGGVGDVRAEELVLLPGLDELFALIDLRDRIRAGRHDVVVVDCAPTAETLRLLALPDALRWYVERILQPGRRFARAVRPVAARVGGVPVPDDEVFGAVDRIQSSLAEVHDLLRDRRRSTVRLVLNPERIVIDEAVRTSTSLALFGYGVDAVIVNRVLPAEVGDRYLAAWKRRHREHTSRVRDIFAPTPVLTAPLLREEPIGVEGVGRLGELLYGERDETAVLHDAAPMAVEDTDEGYVLRLALPNVSADDLDLHRRRDELYVRVDGRKRALALPAALRRCEVAGASLREGHLEVRFRDRVPAGAR